MKKAKSSNVKLPKKTKGKLIVIDGTDGSGKATQVELLRKRLIKEGNKVKIVDFPVYEDFFGKFIAKCQQEVEYSWTKVHPEIASIAYAANRWESKKDMEQWLDQGYTIIANRYASANQIHQGGKIKSAKKRKEFMNWLDTMEHKIFGIPRPDMVIYLALPIKITRELMEIRDKSKRSYLKKKVDLVEHDLQYLENARKSAVWLSKQMKNFVKIECAKDGKILTREAVHESVYKTIKKVVK